MVREAETLVQQGGAQAGEQAGGARRSNLRRVRYPDRRQGMVHTLRRLCAASLPTKGTG